MAVAVWVVGSDGTVGRLPSGEGLLERKLEDWVYGNSSLVGNVSWVARQLALPDQSRIDLLGITADDQWVVAELKAGALDSYAFVQSFHYAIFIGTMEAHELRRLLEANPHFQSTDARVRQQVGALLDAEREEVEQRNLSIMLVGTARKPSLDAGIQFLEGRNIQIPVRIVTFDLFTTASGETVLVREVDEPAPADGRSRTVEAIGRRADQAGVGAAFAYVVEQAEARSLPIKPWARSVTVTVPRPGNPTLLYLRPEDDHLHMWLSEDNVRAYAGWDPDAFDRMGAKEGDFANLDEARAWTDRFFAEYDRTATSTPE